MEDPFDFEWEERADDTPFWVHMIAGSVAGVGEHVLLLPLDNLKTHIQTRSPNLKSAYTEINQNGFRNFFRGSSIITIGCIPSHAFFFVNYEIFKKLIPNQEEVDIFGNMLLGGISNLFHDLVMTPCEMIKQRAQLGIKEKNINIINRILSQEGPMAFWRSFPVNFFSNLPNAMITVSANENLKQIYQKRFGELSMFGYFVCASSAGVLSSLVTTPLDNIKTRLNVQNFYNKNHNTFTEILKNTTSSKNGKQGEQQSFSLMNKRLALKKGITFNTVKENVCNKCNFTNEQSKLLKYPNALCAIKIIMREEGIRGFYKGIGLRLTSQSMSTAISWTIYEFLKKQMVKPKF